MKSSITADWAAGEWIRYLVRTTDRGWANVALTGDVATPNPERGFPRTPPPTAAGLCSAYDMDGKGGTPTVPDWEVEEAINKLAPLRQIIRQGQNAM